MCHQSHVIDANSEAKMGTETSGSRKDNTQPSRISNSYALYTDHFVSSFKDLPARRTAILSSARSSGLICVFRVGRQLAGQTVDHPEDNVWCLLASVALVDLVLGYL